MIIAVDGKRIKVNEDLLCAVEEAEPCALLRLDPANLWVTCPRLPARLPAAGFRADAGSLWFEMEGGGDREASIGRGADERGVVESIDDQGPVHRR